MPSWVGHLLVIVVLASVATNAYLIYKIRARQKRSSDDPELTSTVDFQQSPASLVNPRLPLVVAVDDLAAQHLDDDSYQALRSELTEITRRLLSAAQLESTLDNAQNPFGKISPANVRDGLRVMLRQMGLEPSRGRLSRLRELMGAIFAAGLGMAIEVGLAMETVERTKEVMSIVVMLAASGAAFYFMRE